MYGVSENSTDLSSGGGAIPPGINENVSVTVTFEKLKEDSPNHLLMVNYTDSKGATLRDVIWPINDEQEIARNEATPFKLKRAMVISDKLTIPAGPLAREHVLPRAYKVFGDRVYHIAKAIAGEDAARTVKGASYADFAAKMVDVCKVSAGQLFRVRVVLNNKDYSDIPRYGKFIESMDVEKPEVVQLNNDRLEKTPTQDATSAGIAGGGMEIPDTISASDLPPMENPAEDNLPF